MKHFYLTAVLSIGLWTSALAQKTSLTIDCQTPGWLSSMINYEDQLTVKALTITGYINIDDCKFIGQLINNSLKEIDLTNVTYVNSKILPENIFGLTKAKRINKVSLPLSMEGGDNCMSYTRVDTLIVGSYNCHIITERLAWTYNQFAKHIIIREGVDSIGDKAFSYGGASSNTSNLSTITFPSTLKSIGNKAFSYCDSLYKVNFPPSLSYIGQEAFYNCINLYSIEFPDSLKEICVDAFCMTSYRPDTIVLPVGLERFNFGAFMYATNTGKASDPQYFNNLDFYKKYNIHKVYYFDKNIKYIRNWWAENTGNQGIKTTPYLFSGRPSEIHIKSATPPQMDDNGWQTSGSGGPFGPLHNIKVYVPKGALELYENNKGYRNAIIIEEAYVEGVYIDEFKILHVNDEIILNAIIQPDEAYNKTVEWESSNPDIVSVSNNGLVKAKCLGSSIITVTTQDGGFQSQCKIDVYDHTEGLEMDADITMKIGDRICINAKTLPLNTSDGLIIFTSSDNDVATINNDGEIKGRSKGTCIITATTVDGGYTATCKVKVLQPVEAISLEKHSTTIKVGEEEQMFVQVAPISADNKKINWYSSDESVATVDTKGNVKGVKAGEVWIKGVSDDNSEVADSCKFTVLQPVNGISLNHDNYTIGTIGGIVELEATVLPEDASNKEIRWKSTNEIVCVVSNGTVVAVGYGTSVIIATTSDGGYIATCIIKVEDTTGIENIVNDQSSKVKFYDLSGRLLTKLKHGIVIIQWEDGKRQKVLIK